MWSERGTSKVKRVLKRQLTAETGCITGFPFTLRSHKRHSFLGNSEKRAKI